MKNKLKLSKEELEVYKKIVQAGNMDMMFDFAYVIGRERMAREQLETLTNNNHEK